MTTWRKSMWHDWTIKFPILCEIKIEMEYKIQKIKTAFHNLQETQTSSDGEGDSQLKFPDFLCVDRIKLLQPSDAPDAFAVKMEKLDTYMQPEFDRLARALETYFSEYGLKDLFSEKQTGILSKNNGLNAKKAALIAGFDILHNQNLLENAMANRQQYNNMSNQLVFPSGDEFIDRLMSGKFVKNMYNPQRIYYAVLMYKMRGLLCRGVALRTSDMSFVTRDIEHINPRINRILNELDNAARRFQKSNNNNFNLQR